jgi:hypothetical protein
LVVFLPLTGGYFGGDSRSLQREQCIKACKNIRVYEMGESQVADLPSATTKKKGEAQNDLPIQEYTGRDRNHQYYSNCFSTYCRITAITSLRTAGGIDSEDSKKGGATKRT